MSKDLQRLTLALTERQDQLWLLQNYALQLTVDRSDREVCERVADGLDAIRRHVAAVAPSEVHLRLESAVRDLRAGEVPAEGAQQVFSLVEALTSAAKGETEALRELVSLEDDLDAAVLKESPPQSEQDGSEALVDDFAEADHEDLHLFAAEARDHLRVMELNLLEFEQSNDLELVREIFRGIHSIKGGAQYLGLEATATLSHRIETLLDRIRTESIRLDQKTLSGLLRSVDVMTELIDAVEGGAPSSTDVRSVVEVIEGLLDEGAPRSDGAETGAPRSISSVEPASAPEPIESAPSDEIATSVVANEEDALADSVGTASDVEAETAELGDDELFQAEFRESLDSARELLGNLQQLVVESEKLTVATRNLHSMKGLAGLVEITPIESVTSAMDRLITSSVRHRQELPSDIVEMMDDGMKLLDSMFREYVELGNVATDVSSFVTAAETLAEREFRAANWEESDPWSVLEPPADEGPLNRAFAELIESLRAGDLVEVEDGLAALAGDAELQGYDELAAAARALASDLAQLGQDDLLVRVRELREVLPVDVLGWKEISSEPQRSFQDLVLSIPGLGSKKLERIQQAGLTSCEAVREVGLAVLAEVPGVNLEQAKMLMERCTRGLPTADPRVDREGQAELERRVLQESFDVELVQIYLATTAQQIDAAKSRIREEQEEPARQLLNDLVGAARYMGYQPIERWCSVAGEMLASVPPRFEKCNGFLSDVRKEVERLRLLHERGGSQGEGRPGADSETSELDRIFEESAENHLGHLADDVIAFFDEMNEELLGSIQHHASCIHSGATNIGRDAAVVAAEGLVETIELVWLSPEQAAAEAPRMAIGYLESLFASCGLDAPHLEISGGEDSPVEVHAATMDAPVGAGDVEDDLDPMFETLTGEGIEVQPVTVGDVPSEGDSQTGEAGRELVTEEGSMPVATESGRASAETVVGQDEAPSADVAMGQEAEPAGVPRGLVDAQSTVRVDTEKIDDLMNMMAELVVNRSSFMVLSNEVNELMTRLIDDERIGSAEARELRTVLTRYDEAMNDLGRVSNQLQQGVMRIRMMPIRTLFSRIPRLVRELSLREGRSVSLALSGEDTELDKKVLERLSDPIIHIIRNAVGHGIEPSEERIAAGKPASGRLEISAHHQGNIVVIEIEDDGRGIDYQRIQDQLEKAAKGASSQSGRWSERDLQSAIFLPGFSTSESVTDVSGRGVGLDVVKRNVEELGGQVDVASEPDKYCRFTIRIPLTMAIMQALLVRVRSETYAIPVSSVIEAEFIQRDEIYSVENQQVITVRDTVIPLIQLDQVFAYNYHLEKAPSGTSADIGAESVAPESVYVVVLQGDGREVGMVVNELVGTQDIVIKSLEDELVDARGIAGASILGDGTVTLILDVGELQRMVIDGHTDDVKRSQALRQLERLLRERRDLGIDIVN